MQGGKGGAGGSVCLKPYGIGMEPVKLKLRCKQVFCSLVANIHSEKTLTNSGCTRLNLHACNDVQQETLTETC